MRITCELEPDELENGICYKEPGTARLLSKADLLRRVYVRLAEHVGEGVSAYEFQTVEAFLDRLLGKTMSTLAMQYSVTPRFLESAFVNDPVITKALDYAVYESKDGLECVAESLERAARAMEALRRKAEQMNEKPRKEKEK